MKIFITGQEYTAIRKTSIKSAQLLPNGVARRFAEFSGRELLPSTEEITAALNKNDLNVMYVQFDECRLKREKLRLETGMDVGDEQAHVLFGSKPLKDFLVFRRSSVNSDLEVEIVFSAEDSAAFLAHQEKVNQTLDFLIENRDQVYAAVSMLKAMVGMCKTIGTGLKKIWVQPKSK